MIISYNFITIFAIVRHETRHGVVRVTPRVVVTRKYRRRYSFRKIKIVIFRCRLSFLPTATFVSVEFNTVFFSFPSLISIRVIRALFRLSIGRVTSTSNPFGLRLNPACSPATPPARADKTEMRLNGPVTIRRRPRGDFFFALSITAILRFVRQSRIFTPGSPSAGGIIGFFLFVLPITAVGP